MGTSGELKEIILHLGLLEAGSLSIMASAPGHTFLFSVLVPGPGSRALAGGPLEGRSWEEGT